MYKIAILLVALTVFFHAKVYCAEPFIIIQTSKIGAKSMISTPSPDFIQKGSALKKGEVFRFDTKRFTETAAAYSQGIEKFSKVVNSNVAMICTPESAENFYFVVTLIDDNENVLNVVMNGNYEVWPVGEVYDPFENR